MLVCRVESAHSQLKRFLESAVGSFYTVWLRYNTVLDTHFDEIRRALEELRIKIPHAVRPHLLLRGLHQRVSVVALEHLLEEMLRMVDKDLYMQTSCTCLISPSMGLPCVHEMKEH